MKVIRIAAALFALGVAGGVAANAQTPETGPPSPPNSATPTTVVRPPARGVAPPAVRAAAAQDPQPAPIEPMDFEQFRYVRPVFRLFIPYTVAAGTEVGEVVVVMNDATIEGRVSGDVVVVLGNLRLGSSAVVDGSVVAVGGMVTVANGASVRDDFVVVGGGIEAPASFAPGGDHVVIGSSFRHVTPWLTQGLLWGRVLVPSLPWNWGVVGISLLVSLALFLAFPMAVRACTETLTNRPLGAFFVGMFTLLLIGPISTILAVSVVGIVVIPFLLCAAVVGWMLGKVSVARWIGGGIVRQESPDDRAQSVRSVLIGFAIICVAYMVPLLGLATWALVGVFGLGTATLTAMASLKRERPQRPPKAAPAPPPVEPPSVPLSTPGEPSPADMPIARANVPFENSAELASAGASDRPADLTSFPRATFLDRLAAFTLDLVLVLIAANLLGWDDDVFMFLLLGYHVAFWAWKGTTVGGIVCNLRLVRTDGAPLRPADALVRGLSSLFSAAALGIGFLWILRDPERQAWHDKIAGTYVVSVPRSWPLP